MEKDIESYLRKRVTAAGGLALKLVCPGSAYPFLWRPCLLRGVKGHRSETAQAAAACAWYVAGSWLYSLCSRQQGRR